MRATLYIMLAAALVFTLTPLLAVTGASTQQTIVPTGTSVARSSLTPVLPDYDIREEMSAARVSSLRQAGVAGFAVSDSDLSARAKAISSFRDELAVSNGDGLQVAMNEVGMPKMMFNPDGPLSFPQSGAHDTIARNFLASRPEVFGMSHDQVMGMKMMNEDLDRGTSFLNYEQTINGLRVFQGIVQVVVDARGQVMSVNEGMLIPKVSMKTTPVMSEAQVMQKAFNFAGKTVTASFEMMAARPSAGDKALYRNPLGEGYEDVPSEMMVMRVGQQAVLAMHMYVDAGPNAWYELMVDANTGALLYRGNLYKDAAQGTVYTDSPLAGRTLVSFVGDTTINTATGWMGTSTVTTGNNVDAYLDSDANNAPDPITSAAAALQNGRAFSATQNFTFPFATNVNPRTQRAGAIANLFYFNNMMHDFSYRLGFTESAGNFQVSNLGRGGIGNDSVRAEAQDGSGTNNANFATPPDGQRPRMQMFLFTRGTASLTDDRDGDVDGDVVEHEYTHGISTRLVGGPANSSCLGGVQGGAIGEGTSDYSSVTINLDGLVGEYVTGDLTRGIRRAAYSVPAATIHDSYADLGNQGFEVHSDGEIWAAALTDLLVTLGQTTANRIIYQGLKFTACSPSFLNYRDGILQADQNLNGGANRCTIYRVFARHGMGLSARGNNGTTHVAASDIPATCN